MAAACLALWLGLSVGLEQPLGPMQTLFAAVFSPLWIAAVPSLLVVYLGVGIAWYLPTKIESISSYAVALVVIFAGVFLQAWLAYSKAAGIMLLLYEDGPLVD